MKTSALLRNAKISPYKARLVADKLRGKPVGPALNLLAFSPTKAGALFRTLLESAVANAEHNAGSDIDSLQVSAVWVNEARRQKRLRPRARGRADRIIKRSSHLYVQVSDQ